MSVAAPAINQYVPRNMRQADAAQNVSLAALLLLLTQQRKDVLPGTTKWPKHKHGMSSPADDAGLKSTDLNCHANCPTC